LSATQTNTVDVEDSGTLTLDAGQYTARYGSETLNFQVGTSTSQQIILGDGSSSGGLNILPAGLSFPGKGTVLRFGRILTNAGENLTLNVVAAPPETSLPQPALFIGGIIAVAAAAIIVGAYRMRKGRKETPAPKEPVRIRRKRAEKMVSGEAGKSPEGGAEGSPDGESQMENNTKDYMNPDT
jgi:hypothetical protein